LRTFLGHGGLCKESGRSVSGVGSGFDTGTVLEEIGGTGWWLVGEDGGPGRVLAGPFPDRSGAGWAALDGRLDHAGEVRTVYGVRQGDGVVRRPSPQEWAWLGHLGEQLDRLSDDWDDVLSDADPLTTLVVEVAAALAEAGLPLHDCADRTDTGSAVGGVCLTPDAAQTGIVVAWRQHDRMSVEQVRGAAADALVQQAMNAALGEVLAGLGFAVDSIGAVGGHLVRSVTA
jgi:hypothetical protein